MITEAEEVTDQLRTQAHTQPPHSVLQMTSVNRKLNKSVRD